MQRAVVTHETSFRPTKAFEDTAFVAAGHFFPFHISKSSAPAPPLTVKTSPTATQYFAVTHDTAFSVTGVTCAGCASAGVSVIFPPIHVTANEAVLPPLAAVRYAPTATQYGPFTHDSPVRVTSTAPLA